MSRLNKISIAILVTSPLYAALSGTAHLPHVNLKEFNMRNYKRRNPTAVIFAGAICIA